MDDADIAQRSIEMLEANRPKKVVEILQPYGYCHYCEEPVSKFKLFCDMHCCEDYQKERDAKKRNGL